MPFTLLQVIQATGGFDDLVADTRGNLLEVNYGNGPYLSRFSEDGAATTVVSDQIGYFGAGNLTLLSDGRYLATSGTGYPFGALRGVTFQILNHDGSPATEAKTLYPPDVSIYDQSPGYTVAAATNGGFTITFTDVTRASDEFTVTFPATSDFPHTSETRTAGQDVYSQRFDSDANAIGNWVVADNAVETVENGTANRRVYDQAVFDSVTLTGGQNAYVYFDKRHEGSNSVYGGAEVFTQLSLVIEGKGVDVRGVRVDDNPLHSGGPNGDLLNNSEINGASGGNVVALRNGTLAVIWEENSYVRDDSVFGHFRFTGRDAYIRYYDAHGNALTDATVFLHRGTDLGNISSYVWAEALPDGQIAVAYMDGVSGVNGHGETEAYLGTLGALGSSFAAQRISPDATNSQFFGVRDLVVRSDGTVDVVIDQSGNFPAGSRPNGTYINHFTFGYDVDGQVKGGSAGANKLVGGKDGDLIAAYEGDDRVSAGDGNDIVYGNEGNDRLLGERGNDKLFGNDGDDVLEGGVGRDDLRGGAGIDLLSYAASAKAVQVNLATGAMSGGDAAGDVFREVEGVIGSALSDRLDGDAGDNLLDGGAGVDRLAGGAGNDTFFVDVKSDKIVELGGEGTDTVVASFNFDLAKLANVENVTLVGNATTAKGDAGNNVLTGNALNNVLNGLNGDDTLLGGDGKDTLDGGLGYNSVYGGAGDDAINAAIDFGEDGYNSLYGGTGNDTYTIRGRDASVIREAAGEGNDTAIGYTNVYLAGDSEVETIKLVGDGGYSVSGSDYANRIDGNVGGNYLVAGGGNDVIHGNGGDDLILGGTDDDTIYGDAGKDTLRGDSGADTYVFADGDTAATNDGADIVQGFSQSEGDRISLYLIDANTKTSAVDAFHFIGTRGFAKAGDLHYVQVDGSTYVSGDTDGDKKADFTIRLDSLVDLSGDDFVLKAPRSGFDIAPDEAFGADSVGVGGGGGYHDATTYAHVVMV